MSATPATPSIVVVDPAGNRRAPLPLDAGGLTLGREPGNDIAIDDPLVSRRHLRIGWDGTTATITDLGSSNGTILGETRLAPHEARPWPRGEWLRVGGWFLWLELPAAATSTPSLGQPTLTGTPAPPTPPVGGTSPRGSSGTPDAPMPPLGGPAAPATSTRIRVVLDANTLTVTPGQPAVVRVTLANTGPTVDHLRVSVEGVPAEWVRTPDSEVQLVPGGQATVVVTVNVARSAQNRSGAYPVTVRARSRDNPGESGAAAAMWTVLPFEQGALTIAPSRAIGRTEARYELTLRNDSNTATSYQLTGSDEEQLLRFGFAQPLVPLEPAGSAVVPLTLRAPRRFVGAPLPRRFTVRAINTTGGSPAQEVSGELVHRALMPAWLPVAALALLVIAGTLLFRILGAKPTIAVQISPDPPVEGKPVLLTWDVENADIVQIQGVAGDIDANLRQYRIESWPGTAGSPGSLRVTAKNRWRSDTQVLNRAVIAPTATPEAEPGAPVIVLWEVTPEQARPGEEVTVRWQVDNADNVDIDPHGTVDMQGELTLKLSTSTTVTLTASNATKTVRRQTQVAIIVPGQTPPAGQPTTGTGGGNGQPTTGTGGGDVQPTPTTVQPMETPTMAPTEPPTAGEELVLDDQPVLDVVVAPGPDGIVYARTTDGFYRSADGGITFERQGDPPQGRIVVAIDDPNVLYAGDHPDCFNGGDLIEMTRSRDGGATWEVVPGWQGMRPFHVEAQNPDFFVASDCVLHYASDGETMSGLNVSPEQSDALPLGHPVSVAASGTFFPERLDVVVLNQGSGALISYVLSDRQDGPHSPFSTLEFFGEGRVATNDLRIYVATPLGVFISDDGGFFDSEPARRGLEDVTFGVDPRVSLMTPDEQQKHTGFSAIVVDPEDADRVFLAGREGIYRSDDGGRTWQQIAEMPEVASLAVSIGADRLFASDGQRTRVWTLDGS